MRMNKWIAGFGIATMMMMAAPCTVFAQDPVMEKVNVSCEANGSVEDCTVTEKENGEVIIRTAPVNTADESAMVALGVDFAFGAIGLGAASVLGLKNKYEMRKRRQG